MGRLKTTVAVAAAAALLTWSAAGAQGILPDRTTFVTIDAPMSLPGVVLPAGTYMFRLADTQATRSVVQIFDKDRTKIFATLLTINAERDEPSNEAVITFRETSANTPPAVRYWYYAGERMGHEFVYPKDQAAQIARSSGESVLAVDTTSADVEQMKQGEISRVDGSTAAASEPPAPAQGDAERAQAASPGAPAAQPESAAATAERPVRESDTAAARTTAPAAETQATATVGRDVPPAPAGTSGRSAEAQSAQAGRAATPARELPRTATELPVVGLIGLLSFGAFLVVRLHRRRAIV